MEIMKSKWVIKHINGLYIADRDEWTDDIIKALHFDEERYAQHWVENNSFINSNDIITFLNVYKKY